MISAKSQIKITYFVPSNVQNKKENCLSSRIILNDLNQDGQHFPFQQAHKKERAFLIFLSEDSLA